jgi:hypothetical protein
MFDWLKPKGQQAKRPRTLTTAADVVEVLGQYGELLEKYPSAFVDETWLPVPKDQMRLAFKAALKFAPNEQMREWVKIGWTLLHWFQPGIGPTPLEGKPPKDPRSKDPRDILAMAQFERYVELLRTSQVEMERDNAEMDAFIRNNL